MYKQTKSTLLVSKSLTFGQQILSLQSYIHIDCIKICIIVYFCKNIHDEIDISWCWTLSEHNRLQIYSICMILKYKHYSDASIHCKSSIMSCFYHNNFNILTFVYKWCMKLDLLCNWKTLIILDNALVVWQSAECMLVKLIIIQWTLNNKHHDRVDFILYIGEFIENGRVLVEMSKFSPKNCAMLFFHELQLSLWDIIYILFSKN